MINNEVEATMNDKQVGSGEGGPHDEQVCPGGSSCYGAGGE